MPINLYGSPEKQMSELHPLRFIPIFKEKIWGGRKIKTVLNKDFGNLNNCGESWEISGVQGNISIVSEGPLKGERLDHLIQKYGSQLVGDSVYRKFGYEFPLLIKFIDANDDLSIQVHPDDSLAKKRHNSFGKTEMWYILHADSDARLISGFNRSLDKKTYLEYFNSERLMELLNSEKVEKDDIYFLPAGRIHTIGKGLLLAEIQQTSDVTYRIFDFNRTDGKGNKRELHLEESLDALDFSHSNDYKTRYLNTLNQVNTAVECPYFHTNVLKYDRTTQRDYSKIDSFVILIGLEGKFIVEHDGDSYPLKMGETLLIPAGIKTIRLVPERDSKILETFVPINEDH